jgi:SPP1 gp7 family putative phage head morphogenesis protein
MNNNYPLHIEKQQEQIYVNAISKLSRAVNKKVKQECNNLDSAKFAEIENQMYAELTKVYLTTEFLTTQFNNVNYLLDAWVYSKLRNEIRKALLKKPNKFYSVVFQKDDPLIQDFINAYTRSNIELVQTLGKQYIPQISQLASKTFLEGGSSKELAYQMLKFTDENKNKAAFWGRNELGSAYSEFTQARQTSVGIREYIWRSVGDNKVREAHQELNGMKFNWLQGARETGLLDDTPGARHPGQPYNCRCSAEPVIEI